ncbi:beta-lactamase family protein [Kitasatospora sp. NBC_01250]|uniref:serine hydrolase domain-containing protein n=1 Tax=unclassified Kitasatospora TaxID=2633591 RepID=UPI002E0E8978|nr:MULTISPECIES: serine hydrolase domain-containing protein [unclassified Kitasatospora]WSJ70773.1 beta-lactamase family protein [Kitasatospora sp. NBC_01302]
MRSVRLIAAAASLTLAALAGIGPASADVPSAVAILQAGAKQGVLDGYPGEIGLVRQGDSTTYIHEGNGTVTGSVPADPQALFRIGSNTKAFVSTVLLQLEAEGRLSLDDSVAKWLPNAVTANGYDGSKITVRELLNHTSGLPDYLPLVALTWRANLNPNQSFAPQDLVNLALNSRKPTTAPGQQWAYSNTGYLLAGMVITAVTGNSPADEIQNRIITPLDLTHTSFPSGPGMSGTYLHGYQYVSDFLLLDSTVSDVQITGTAGAMVSNMDDLAAFSRALLTGKLLPPAQEAELKTGVPTDNTGTSYYGLGIVHSQMPCGTWAWSHNGSVLGYFSTWASNDDGTKQVVLVNNEYHLAQGTTGQRDTGTALMNAYCAL